MLLAGMGVVLGIAMTAEAEEGIQSRGTFQFHSAAGAVSIWAEDISLLQDKISGIPKEAFDPGYYSQARGRN